MVTTSTSNLPTVSSDEAILSSSDGFTAFSFGGYRIRFRAPYSLERYVDVVKWDDGYLVVLAKYSHNPEPAHGRGRVHGSWIHPKYKESIKKI